MREDIAVADRGSADTIQIVTWNDFAEGSCIEPSFQYGQLYLEILAEWHARRNRLEYVRGRTLPPYQWFVLAKRFGAGEAAGIRDALARGDHASATRLIDELAGRHAYAIPPVIDRENEFAPYTVATPQALAPKPDGSIGEQPVEVRPKRVARPMAEGAANLLPEKELRATGDGGGGEGWRVEISSDRKGVFATHEDGSLRITPLTGNGRALVHFYSAPLSFPAGTELEGSVWVKNCDAARIYAVSSGWKPVPAWEDKAFVAGEKVRAGPHWERVAIRFTAPGEDFPFRFRFDVDTTDVTAATMSELYLAVD